VLLTGRLSKFIDKLREWDWAGAIAVLSHYVTLPLIAIAIVVVLVSEEVLLRLAGIIALIFLEQIRDAWVVREMPGRAKKG